jgi:squalene-associated FAD-dependent desaturase
VPEATKHVAVVGAGYAGLAAAMELTRAGAAVTLYEANRVAGGRARRVEYRESLLDNGQHLLLGAYRETLELIEEVGASHGLARFPLTLLMPPRFALVAPRWPAPLHLAAALLRAKGLSWGERLAAMRFALALKRARFKTRHSTVAQLVASQPPHVRRWLWEPLCLSALNTPMAEADAQVFVNVLRDAFFHARRDSDLVIPTVDLSALFPDAALEWLGRRGTRLRLGARVNALELHGAQWIVRGSEKSETFDAVVCAVAPFQAHGLLPDIPALARLKAGLQTLGYEPISTVYLQYDAPARLPFPMVALGQGYVQWVFDREALSGAHGLLAAVISASGPHLTLGQDMLGTVAHREICAALGPRAAPRWTKSITEKRATFACTPGAFRPEVATGAPGLVLAGDYIASDYPATLESAVRSGRRAARSLIASFQR